MSASDVQRRRRGWWSGGSPPAVGEHALVTAVQRVGAPVYAVDVDGQLAAAQDGTATLGGGADDQAGHFALLGYAPALRPEQLGDPAFREAHGVRYAYVGGAMANGISSEEMVEALGRAGMLGFFGAAGIGVDQIAAAIERIRSSLGDASYGFNLIHNPNEPRVEAETVELYLRRGVSLISASAYLGLTEPLIRYRVTGIHRDGNGCVVAPNRVMAKVSRIEVARRFFTPPPEAMLRSLVEKGAITTEQAELAKTIPVAEELTAEADSAGHTDNRPALALLPTMLALRDAMQAEFGYRARLRVGAAGGIATPAAAAAAFAMGAAYVLTGSVNQGCVEAGTSDAVRTMLAEARQADVTMAPAADMFEMGVKVQVLKRGTMFAMRARKLWDLYQAYGTLEDIPAGQRSVLERDYFRAPLEEVWQRTKEFFATRDQRPIERAERDPKYKMALVFRSYLGQSSNWANAGEPSRKVDYQVWCGPAMGAFNEWTRGSCLERPENRDVVSVALNLLVGAAALTRAGWLRTQGVPLPAEAERFAPRSRAELDALLR
jgi:PfaD family protein